MTDATAGTEPLDAVWRAFCASLAEVGAVLARPSAPRTALDQAEGLRYLSRLTRTALNMLVDSADPDFPRLFSLCDDTLKIGADNPDMLYQQCVVRPDRTYRITGRCGTVPYLSIGSKANRYAIDGTMVSTGEVELADLAVQADGTFTITVSREPQPGNWLPMAEDTSLLIIRQTFSDRRSETPADIRIERIGPGLVVPGLLDPATIERQLQAAAAWVGGTANTFADWSELFRTQSNRIFDGPQDMFQRGGGDPNIWYGHIHYDLAPGDALVIEAVPPPCRLWNFQLDNWWMESLDYVHRPVWANSAMVAPDAEGRVTLVCADADPGFGHWLDLAGHRRGTGLWRWIGASEHPVPRVRVVTL